MGIWNDILVILGVREPSPQQIIYASEPSESVTLVPTHAGNQFVMHEGAAEYRPHTKESIEKCYREMRAWAGYEEGRGKELHEQVPSSRKFSAEVLSWNFDQSTNPFMRMINDEFYSTTGEIATNENLYHIFGNAFNGLDFSNIRELYSENKQDVIDFLMEERVFYLGQVAQHPKFDPETDTSYHYMTARIALGALDKLTELMLGPTLAAEIARESEREGKRDVVR